MNSSSQRFQWYLFMAISSHKVEMCYHGYSCYVISESSRHFWRVWATVSCWRVGLLHKPSFLFALVWQTGCGMWIEQRIPLGVGRKGGWLPSLGYSGKEGVTFLFVRIKGWQAQRRADLGWVAQGSLGSFAPIITFAAAGAGLTGRAAVGKTSPMMYAPQACRTFSWSWMGTVRLVLWSTVAWLHSMNEWVQKRNVTAEKVEVKLSSLSLCNNQVKRLHKFISVGPQHRM